jgi:hypothetical protein
MKSPEWEKFYFSRYRSDFLQIRRTCWEESAFWGNTIHSSTDQAFHPAVRLTNHQGKSWDGSPHPGSSCYELNPYFLLLFWNSHPHGDCWELGSLRRKLKLNQVLRVGPQSDRTCVLKGRGRGTKNSVLRGKALWGHCREDTKRGLGETNPSSTLILDFQPGELRNMCLLFVFVPCRILLGQPKIAPWGRNSGTPHWAQSHFETLVKLVRRDWNRYKFLVT